MSIEQQSMPIEECRTFIAALLHDTASPEPTYVAVTKRGGFSVYYNSYEKQDRFRTKEILETARCCFLHLESIGTKGKEEERQALLEQLYTGLRQYKRRVKPSSTQSLCGLLHNDTIHQISRLYHEIKTTVEDLPPQEGKKSHSEEAKRLLAEMESFSSHLTSLQELWEEEEVVRFAQNRTEELEVWRAACALLPWHDCNTIFKKLLMLEKEVLYLSQNRLFYIELKKDVARTKALIERIRENLSKVEAEFTQKLEAIQGYIGFYTLLFWIEMYPSGTVMELKENRFCSLSEEDCCFPEAVEVSKEIASLLECSQKLEEAFRARIEGSHYKKENESKTFQDLMRECDKDITKAEALAQGNERLLATIKRWREASQNNAPALIFEEEGSLSDRGVYDRSVRRSLLQLHPDKNRGYEEAAKILFTTFQKIAEYQAF